VVGHEENMSVNLQSQSMAGSGASGSPASASAPLLPWARLIGGLSAIEAVPKLGVVAAGENVDLWVILRDEDDAAEAELSRLEREYRIAVGPSPFELYVAALTVVDEANLPPFEIIFSR
jgi:hypothetical protein